MFKIGLTGGIASGKSTVAGLFATLGGGLVDTDIVARDVVAPGTEGLKAVTARFGAGVLDTSGGLDRARLRRLVFADNAQRRELEAILHPLIRAETLERIGMLSAPYAIIAVPLLVETGFDELVDRVLVVDCPEAMQLKRLRERDGIGETEAKAMIAAQITREKRLAAADDIIDNSKGMEALGEQVSTLHALYVSESRNCPEPEAHAE